MPRQAASRRSSCPSTAISSPSAEPSTPGSSPSPRRCAPAPSAFPDLGAPLERGWTIDIERSHLEACAEHGFTAIRLLITLGAHRTPAGLDPDMLRRVEAIVDDATAQGLAVVISNNPQPELMADPEPHLADSLATAAQLARTFQGRGTDVTLEPLTEPQQALDPIWNNVAAELIGAVRDQDRRCTILIGPRTMNNARFLGELSLPESERNLIVGIHHYWPIRFTMQGNCSSGKTTHSATPGTGSGPPGSRHQPRKSSCAPDSLRSPAGAS